MCGYTVGLCSNRTVDSKLAPPEKDIRSDNFSKQILHIPLLVYVIAAYFAALHSPGLLLRCRRKLDHNELEMTQQEKYFPLLLLPNARPTVVTSAVTFRLPAADM